MNTIQKATTFAAAAFVFALGVQAPAFGGVFNTGDTNTDESNTRDTKIRTSNTGDRSGSSSQPFGPVVLGGAVGNGNVTQ